MPLVKYVSNLSYNDGTGAVSLGPERVLTLGGLPLDVSDTELSLLQSKFGVEVVESDDSAEDVDVDDKSAASVSGSVNVPTTTTVPVSSTTVSVGSTPSSPPTNQSSPTPSAGN